MRLSTTLTILGISCVGLAAGCRSRPEPILDTPVGPLLGGLWEAHGGLEAWREHAGLAFEYTAEFSDGSRWSAPIALIFDDPARVWIREGGEPPSDNAAWVVRVPGREVELRRRDAALGRVSLPGYPGRATASHDWTDRPSPPLPSRVDFALASARNLGSLPFGLAGPGWELRLLVGPELRLAATSELEARPLADPRHLGPYLLRRGGPAARVPAGDDLGGGDPAGVDSSGGDPMDTARTEGISSPLRRVWYASSHPWLPGVVLEVRFDDLVEVDGVRVAARREHHLPRRGSRFGFDPFRPELRGSSTPPAPPVLVERLERLRFLDESDVREIRPEDEGEAAATTLDGVSPALRPTLTPATAPLPSGARPRRTGEATLQSRSPGRD